MSVVKEAEVNDGVTTTTAAAAAPTVTKKIAMNKKLEGSAAGTI